MLKRSFSLFLPLRSVQRAGQKHGVCGSARWTLRLPQPAKASLQHSWLITGITKEPEYDEWGNLTNVIYPDGSEESYEYEHTHHRWIKTVDKDGTVTRYEWDEATGHLLRETRQPAGTGQEQVTEYTYDANDRRKTITEKGDGTTPDAVTTYEYDAAGNLVTIFKPDGNTIEFTYDDRGNAISKKDKFGEWKYIYNDLGHLITIEDPWN